VIVQLWGREVGRPCDRVGAGSYGCVVVWSCGRFPRGRLAGQQCGRVAAWSLGRVVVGSWGRGVVWLWGCVIVWPRGL
jgi:hypothetical protein